MVSSPVARVIKNVMPHGLVMSIVRSQAVRRWRIKTQTSANLPVVKTKYSYSAAVDFLSANDLPRDSVIAGSIPEASLEFCTKILDELLPSGVPLIGLHIGNFVGISLSHFVDYARRKSEQSMIVSIDPNLICMGILDPQKHVIALLNYFGLQKNVMITVGYSGEKSISNDGYAFIDNKGEEYDPFAGYVKEQSCEFILASYCLISEGHSILPF